MFNSGGIIQELEYFDSEAETCVKIEVKGGGNFLSYSNASPEKCFFIFLFIYLFLFIYFYLFLFF
ncbi:hypothetical protein NC653_033206 [Populus alba x Populus x berolinensis]|uniref:Uncharacterized protein n=1 Tax=Populus alba x Populus x berolinensis TaxID=444605 RepID=A0AAD6Q028_9ROSI|nr:hypothetical protein NC653_033206 [Populus alba x Populus x berolinensis]